MQIKKYRYVRLPDVSKEVEITYNKMKRREQYLYEYDFRNNLVYYQNEDELYDLNPNIETPEQIAENQRQKDKAIIALRMALVDLRLERSADFEMVYDYFLSGKKISFEELGKRYGYSKQAACKKLHRILNRLRKLVIMHINS